MSLIQQRGHKRLINVFLSFLFSHCFVVLRIKPSILLKLGEHSILSLYGLFTAASHTVLKCLTLSTLPTTP